MTVWKDYQPIEYPDKELLATCQLELSQKEPLVSLQEIYQLRNQLASIQTAAMNSPERRRHLLLQLGHCAETFNTNTVETFEFFAFLFKNITEKFISCGVQVLPMLRMAGQFAKPRSCLYEQVPLCSNQALGNNNRPQVFAYRGDIVNGASLHERTPNPERLLKAYEESAAALRHIRQAFLHESQYADENMHESQLNLHETHRNSCESVFTMHEFLCLPFEIPLMKSLKENNIQYETKENNFENRPIFNRVSSQENWKYSSSAHALWLGDRTAFPDSLHAHLLARLENPIGIKVGPSKTPAMLLELLEIINPQKQLGKIMIITRFGVGQVRTLSRIYFSLYIWYF